jgi:nicotinamidase-related amidase
MDRRAGDHALDDKVTGVVSVPAEPYEVEIEPAATALIIIDMQRDFVEPGGFGEQLGNDVGPLRAVIAPLRRVLDSWRGAGLTVVHTREGHRPDLCDCPPTKRARGRLACGIGDEGPMGRILIRGSYGHGIVDELAPLETETVVDKPGKGAFFATDLDLLLHNRGIRSLVVTGVTTEVCVATTVREANDRGYECLVLSDCVGSYFPDFHRASLEMVSAQGAIFGWVTDSGTLRTALEAAGR